MLQSKLAKPFGVVAALAALALLLPLAQAGNTESFKTAWSNAASKVGGNGNAVVVSQSADLNIDGTVDDQDLLRFMQQWHTEGTVVTAPEPQEQVHSEIIGVTIPADNKPVITYTLLDGNGQPFDPATPGLTVRWTIARITTDDMTNGGTRYDNYIKNAAGQPTTDSGGTTTDLGNGQYSYKFKTAIVVANPAETHTIGGQIEVRALGIAANPLINFRPDGQAVTVTRELTTTATCNKCHDLMAFHGGGRREFGFCILCHNVGVMDPESGNTVDMANMIHKIHRGENLPSVQSGTPYQIIGHNNSVNDFSDVAFPQDVRNCNVCHNGPQADAYKMVPSRRACGACHDDLDFSTHMGGQSTDAACKFCHQAVMTAEFDASIPGAHTVPYKSTQLTGLHGEILSVSNTAKGEKPLVTFKLYDNANGVINPASLDSVRANMAGPTTDYTTQIREDIKGAAGLTILGGGLFSYQFTAAIPMDTTGTWAFSLEARSANKTLATDRTARETMLNPIVFASVDGSAVAPRRTVIDGNKCNVCHDYLNFHGGNRVNLQYCQFCHNPTLYEAEGEHGQSVDFKVLVHKIHMGDELTKEYNFGNRHYKDTRYPAHRTNCAKCHEEGTYFAPSKGVANTIIKNATGDVVLADLAPTTAACTACHDTDPALAHAQSNTGTPSGVEACGVCHGQFRSEAVDVVHGE